MNNTGLEVVKESKILGTILTNNLSWNKNTLELVKRGFKRMQLLYKAASFTNSRHDLKTIYLTYVRSVIEQSAVVWHSSLTIKIEKILNVCKKLQLKLFWAQTIQHIKMA